MRWSGARTVVVLVGMLGMDTAAQHDVMYLGTP